MFVSHIISYLDATSCNRIEQCDSERKAPLI